MKIMRNTWLNICIAISILAPLIISLMILGCYGTQDHQTFVTSSGTHLMLNKKWDQ